MFDTLDELKQLQDERAKLVVLAIKQLGESVEKIVHSYLKVEEKELKIKQSHNYSVLQDDDDIPF